MRLRLRLAVDGMFVFTETLAWFFAMYVFSSIYERSVLSDLVFRLDAASTPGGGVDAIAGARAAEVALQAARTATSGPQWYVVLGVALAAFSLTRFLRSARLGRAGTVLGILVSLAVLSIAWRVVLVGDVRFWDYAAVAHFFEDSNSSAFLPINVAEFTRNADVTVADGRSQGLGLIGVLALWIRFLFAGRSPRQFEGVLRSFSATFPVVLLATMAGSAAGVPGGGIALVYFTSAVLTLALANARRATDRGAVTRLNEAEGWSGRARAALTTPWAFAAAATIAVVLATGVTLIVLSSVNAGAAALVIGGMVGKVIEFILVIFVTPLYWIASAIGRWLGLGQVDLSFMSKALDSAQLKIDPSQAGDTSRFYWVGDAMRLLAFAALAYVTYRFGQYMFRRLESRRADNDEGDRSTVSTQGGFGHLLRAAFPGRRSNNDGDERWLRRQPAYWLYGRMVRDAAERRFAPRPGETPLEFAAASAGVLNAPVFEGIAVEFDRARYGGHFRPHDELRPLADALREWEAANPITDEMRLRPGRDEEAPDIEDIGGPSAMPEAPAELMPPV
ncbi:MAG: DUF4129 domain-containing protein [Dehalococcoidia bacterium]|nr:DUF4129 domain-containing protein [Dehalococcoidia bacterium]